MKLSANEEYGLRCLVRIGYAGEGGSLTIPEMRQAEGVSPAYAAKIRPADRIVKINDTPIHDFGQLNGYLEFHAAEPLTVTIERAVP